MTLKTFTGIKKLTTPTITILYFWVGVNWTVPAGLADQPPLDQKGSRQSTLMVAQSETRTTTAEKTAPPSESSASESETREKKESEQAGDKPLKEFSPSERIEAEQAVDFPYDI